MRWNSMSVVILCHKHGVLKDLIFMTHDYARNMASRHPWRETLFGCPPLTVLFIVNGPLLDVGIKRFVDLITFHHSSSALHEIKYILLLHIQ